MSVQSKPISLVTTVDDNILNRYTFNGLYRNGVKSDATLNGNTITFSYNHPIGKEESIEYKWVANNFSHSITFVIQGLIAGPVALRLRSKWDEDLSSVAYTEEDVVLSDGNANTLLTATDTDINKDLLFYISPLAEANSMSPDTWENTSGLTYQGIDLQTAFIGIYKDSYSKESPSDNLISATFPKDTTTALYLEDLTGTNNKIIVVFDPDLFVTTLKIKSNIGHTVAVNGTNYNLKADTETSIKISND